MQKNRQENPELSIIVINYKTRDITKDCIDSVLAETKKTSYELILIDNNSADDSLEMLRSYEKEGYIRLVENAENTGFGRANNQGVQLARGHYILLLNSDTIIRKSAIDTLMGYYKAHKQNIAFLGPTLLNKDGSGQTSCGPFYSPLIVFIWLLMRGDHWGASRHVVTQNEFVDWVSGACILTTKDHYNYVHGFDEKIFMYMEEIDLLYRARQKGLRTAVTPTARITHLGSASSKKTFPILQVYKGLLYFYTKHYSPFQKLLVRGILYFKAYSALIIGYARKNAYLLETYGEALQILKTYDKQG